MDSFGRAHWVDILGEQLHLGDGAVLKHPHGTPSCMFEVGNGREIYVVSDRGLLSMDGLSLERKTISFWGFDGSLELDDFRANDAAYFEDLGYGLVGFMHRTDPGSHPGFILKFCLSGSVEVFAEDIFIPNGFVRLDAGHILIADSKCSRISKFEISTGRVTDWYWGDNKSAGGVPDGGVKVGDMVFFAMWGGSCVRIFSKLGQHLHDLAVPCIFPTNVKADLEGKNLWITSALQGDTGAPATPYCGHTLRLRWD